MAVKNQHRMSIGRLAARTGLAVSAIRFYESIGLLSSIRNAGGQRRFKRSDIRRLSFVMISQQLGFSLDQIRQHMESLPDQRTPTQRDWQQLGRRFRQDIDAQIDSLTDLRDKLSGCIGCGCLSLQRCQLYNPDDRAANNGVGPRYLLGDKPTTCD